LAGWEEWKLAEDWLCSVAGNTPPTKKQTRAFLDHVKHCCELAEWEPETFD